MLTSSRFSVSVPSRKLLVRSKGSRTPCTNSISSTGRATGHIAEPRVDLRFVASGFLGVTEWWLDQHQSRSLHEVAAQLHDLLTRVVQPPPNA